MWGAEPWGGGQGPAVELHGSAPPHCSEPHVGVGMTLLCPHRGLLLLGLQNPSLLLETVMSPTGAEL